MADEHVADDVGARPDEVVAFWELARARAKVGRLPIVTGVDVAAAMTPPAWAFGDNPRLADELLALVLAGEKTGTSTAVAELAATGEPEPRVGELSIILDGAGHPRALIRTTRVRRCRFDDVDEEFAASEGEGDRSVANWRSEHERYWRRMLAGTGVAVDGDLEVIAETFELLYPRPPRSARSPQR